MPTTIDEMRSRSKREAVARVADGLEFEIKPLTAGGFCDFQQPLVDAGSKKRATPADKAKAIKQSQLVMVRHCVVSPDISVMSDDELMCLPPRLWTELTAACMEVSGLSDADAEDLAKNSVETAGEDSPTG